MDTGFNYYHGADPSEYDFVVSNSEGGCARLLELGARRVETVFWAADPEFFAPQPVEKDADVFFYGYGDKFRREWMQAMVGEPSRGARRRSTSRSAAATSRATSARRGCSATSRSTSSPRAISAARVNLNITRRSHATVSGLVDVPAVRARRRRARRSSPTRTRASSAGSSPGASWSSSRMPSEALDAYRDAARRSRRRRRRWACGRASACSTSTRTPSRAAGARRSLGPRRRRWRVR